MISAKLIESLEKEGFKLNFPSYSTNEEKIIEILNEKNERLLLALPLILKYEFDYKKIINKLNKKYELMQTFNKIINITNEIYQKEKINNSNIQKCINSNKIKLKINKEEFNKYYEEFKEAQKTKENTDENQLKDQIKVRNKLNINKALSELYSPGKIQIMEKIFNYEKLSNTELKYYYRSIRPLINAILNEDMKKYLGIIQNLKKLKE